MSRVVRFHKFGGPEVLSIEDATVRSPSAGEVRLRVKAIGLNRAESLMRRGAYIETPDLPSGLGLEAAGIVEAVGASVTGLSVGDSVSLIPATSMIAWPTYGELAVFPAAHVVRHPAHLSWAHAAATWMAYLTAYGALIDIAAVSEGDTVVITAASSSVGLAAIQIANAIGARPIAVTRTHEKSQALRQAGASDVLALSDGDLAPRVQALTGGVGARVVLDAVGGPLIYALTDGMCRDGILIEYGGLSAKPTPFPLLTVLSKRLTLKGYLVHEIIEDQGRLERAKTFILNGLRRGVLSPVIDRVFCFDQIRDAHRYLESNTQFGKIVITLEAH